MSGKVHTLSKTAHPEWPKEAGESTEKYDEHDQK